MEAGRTREAGRDVAPDRFTVHLNPQDLADLGDPQVLAGDVASGALTFARSHELALLDRPRVSIRPDATVQRGEVEVEASLSPPPAEAAAGDAGTRVFEIPVPRAPKASLEIREPGRLSRRIEIAGGPMRIGRAAECEVALKDGRVSRQHARLHARDGHLVLTDLGSTNGTRVNGQRIEEVVLGDGDRIVIGDTELVVASSQDDAAAR
jgi:hypothetical protein